MRFYIQKVYLWFSEETKTCLDFEPNKVNIIRGNSSRGKSNIFAIIDYCLMSDKPNIVEPIINQYTEYYGIEIQLGDTHYSIFRKKPEDNVGADSVYMDYKPFTEDFYPGKVNPNRQVSDARKELDRKFGLTSDAYIYPWGKNVDNPFVVSFRPFLMYNALTENIISSQYEFLNYKFFEDTYVDSQDKRDYLLDVLLGVDGVKEKQQRELVAKLASEQNSNKRRISGYDKAIDKYTGKLQNAVYKLAKVGIDVSHILSSDIKREEQIRILEEIVVQYWPVTDKEKSEADARLTSLRRELYTKRLQLNNIETAKEEYDQYYQELSHLGDCLKPVEYLRKHLKDMGLTMWSNTLLNELQKSLNGLRENIRKPDNARFVNPSQIENLKKEITRLEKDIQEYTSVKIKPVEQSVLYVAVGEVSAMIPQLQELSGTIPTSKPNAIDYAGNNEKKQRAEQIIEEISLRRATVVRGSLDPAIQGVFDQFTQLENFKGCKTRYDRKHERLELSDGKSVINYNNVGSQSNYMFLHLSFFLGLHKYLKDYPCTHISPFLFIDQPSIPYYEATDDDKSTDKAKLLDAFSVINTFMQDVTMDDDGFQIILIEHAPSSYWTGENALEYFVTKREFEGDQALVPYSVIDKKKAENEQNN